MVQLSAILQDASIARGAQEGRTWLFDLEQHGAT
jgi:hypothetical protein